MTLWNSRSHNVHPDAGKRCFSSPCSEPQHGFRALCMYDHEIRVAEPLRTGAGGRGARARAAGMSREASASRPGARRSQQRCSRSALEKATAAQPRRSAARATPTASGRPAGRAAPTLFGGGFQH